MKVFFQTSGLQLKDSILTMGNFDGLHRGHQKLISSLFKLSRKLKKPSVLVTYTPHPVKVLKPGTWVDELLSFKDFKIELQNLGLEYLVFENFTQSLSRMGPEEYLKKYIIRPFRPQFLVLGENFFFGNKKKGNLIKLKNWEKKYSYQLRIEPLLKINECENIKRNQNESFISDREKDFIKNSVRFKKTSYDSENVISSTKIKSLLKEGEIKKANFLLGRIYFLRGVIEKGKQRGRKLGYPTLNLKVEGLFLPRNGVYRSSFLFKNKYFFSITNIGIDPTFEKSSKKNEKNIQKEKDQKGKRYELNKQNGKSESTKNSVHSNSIGKKVETFAFLNKENENEFLSEKTYGEEMILYLYEFLRPEEKFKNAEALKTQISLDIKKCKKINSYQKK